MVVTVAQDPSEDQGIERRRVEAQAEEREIREKTRLMVEIEEIKETTLVPVEEVEEAEMVLTEEMVEVTTHKEEIVEIKEVERYVFELKISTNSLLPLYLSYHLITL